MTPFSSVLQSTSELSRRTQDTVRSLRGPTLQTSGPGSTDNTRPQPPRPRPSASRRLIRTGQPGASRGRRRLGRPGSLRPPAWLLPSLGVFRPGPGDGAPSHRPVPACPAPSPPAPPPHWLAPPPPHKGRRPPHRAQGSGPRAPPTPAPFGSARRTAPTRHDTQDAGASPASPSQGRRPHPRPATPGALPAEGLLGSPARLAPRYFLRRTRRRARHGGGARLSSWGWGCAGPLRPRRGLHAPLARSPPRHGGAVASAAPGASHRVG